MSTIFEPRDFARDGVPDLPSGEVHLWLGDLRQGEERLTAFRGLLSADEEERRGRFRFERHRRRFLVRRGLLRSLLGAYLAQDPGGLEFDYGEQGKPFLRGHEGLLFNLSDSEDGVLIAVAEGEPGSGRLLGADLELRRAMRNTASLGRRVFSAADHEAWYGLPEGQRDMAFLRLWTRKEAILKATGEGILAKPRRYSVTLDPRSPARLLAIDEQAEAARGWWLEHFDPPGAAGEPGYLAALAVYDPAAASSPAKAPRIRAFELAAARADEAG